MCFSDPLRDRGGSVGGVFVSTDPAGGPSAWMPEKIDPESALHDVTCTAPALCLATDEHGNVLSSIEPAAGPGAWKLEHIDGNNVIVSVSCATASLCVAVDQAGTIFVSTSPAGGEWISESLPWPSPPAPPEIQEFHVSCIQGPLCVIVGKSAIFASTDPAGGVSAWSADDGVDGSGGVACASVSRCVAFPGDTNGPMITTGAPTSAGSWKADGVGDRFISAVSCVLSSSCVAVDRRGNAYISIEPHLLSVALLGPGLGTVDSTPISCPFLTCSHEVPGIIEPAESVQVACTDTLALIGLGRGPFGTCALDYPPGDVTALTAKPAPGSVFAGWGGSCSGTAGCSLSMSEDRSVSATFLPAPAGSVPDPSVASVPRLFSLRETNRSFAVARQRTRLFAATTQRHPRGTVFSFELDRSANVDIKLSAVSEHSLMGHHCPQAHDARGHARRCNAYKTIAVLVRNGHPGRNTVAFSGRVGAKAMHPGLYRAAFTAANGAGDSAVQDLSFTILGH